MPNPNLKLCPCCDTEITEQDEYCPYCGYILIEDYMSLYEKLKDLEDKIMFFSYQFEGNPSFNNKDLFPVINYFKSTICKSPDTNFQTTILQDLFNWMCFISFYAKNTISDTEIKFLNVYMQVHEFTREEIIYLYENNTPYKVTERLPVSFMIFYETDLYFQINKDNNLDYAKDNNLTDILFELYKLMGILFVGSTGEALSGRNEAYTKGMECITKYLNEFRSNGYDNFVKYIDGQNQGNIDINYNFTPTATNVEVNNPNISLQENSDNDKTLENYIDELNKLIGLGTVKNDVNSLINLIQVRQVREQRGMKQPPISLHLVFSGNPGTGKTTVARLLSKIYHKMGLLSKGHLIETDRSGLVGGYVGQTAIKTQEVIQTAMGGILFIDEAYTLSSSKGETDYGQESIDTILKAMEDHRDDLIVIVAGYPKLMEDFLQSNPGLKSRFNKFIYFEDYNPEELYGIFKKMCDENNLILEDKADEFVKTHFIEVYNNRGENFANGRDVRNLFENVLTNQANRISSNLNISDEELNTLKYEDFK